MTSNFSCCDMSSAAVLERLTQFSRLSPHSIHSPAVHSGWGGRGGIKIPSPASSPMYLDRPEEGRRNRDFSWMSHSPPCTQLLIYKI